MAGLKLKKPASAGQAAALLRFGKDQSQNAPIKGMFTKNRPTKGILTPSGKRPKKR